MLKIKKYTAILLAIGMVLGNAGGISVTGYAAEMEEDLEESQNIEIHEEEDPDIEQEPDLDETDEVDEPDPVANSWRYTNGTLNQENKRQAPGSTRAWRKENGQYYDGLGNVLEGVAMKGMDISAWQEKVDWEKAKADGIEFVILRCGYGRDRTRYDDKWWERNASECERLGIPYGVYLYSYADSLEYAESEADHTLRLLEGHHPTLPVYYDLEDAVVKATGQTMIGQMAKLYLDKVAAAGYQVGVYANLNWWQTQLTDPVFQNEEWSRWVAQWSNLCTYDKDYDIWQCTDSGSVNGVSGPVDLNFWMSGKQQNSIVRYSSHIQSYGWQREVKNGSISGVTGEGKRMEALQISIGTGYGDLGLSASAHVQSYGWMKPVSSGQILGTVGAGKRMEAIKLQLTGTEREKYDIYYRVHVQSYGWLDWAMNGQAAGTEGYGKRIEAVQISVLEKGTAAPGNTAVPFRAPLIKYTTHVQTYGWGSESMDGAVSGTVGKQKRLEAIKISLQDSAKNANLVYQTHVQTYGWQKEVTGGQLSGTSGRAKRLEAIRIRLTGEMEKKYDVYYRVHAQTYGWLDWAANGVSAGTEGKAKRLEAIQIVLVEKGGTPPGSTGRPFVK